MGDAREEKSGKSADWQSASKKPQIYIASSNLK
jgi:hypothetical protein